MSQPITIEDMYKLFEKTNEQLERSRQEFDRRTAETDRSLAESRAEFDRRMAESKAETDRGIAELRKAVANANRAVDNLTTRWGCFVEELVEPAAVRLFQARGIDVIETYPRAKTKRQGVAMEIDILVVNDTSLVLIECKSRLSRDDVDEFLEKLAKFKDSFPHYKNYRAYGAVAGIEIDQGVDRYAYQRGLFVIEPAGDSVEITNDESFQPRTW